MTVTPPTLAHSGFLDTSGKRVTIFHVRNTKYLCPHEVICSRISLQLEFKAFLFNLNERPLSEQREKATC